MEKITNKKSILINALVIIVFLFVAVVGYILYQGNTSDQFQTESPVVDSLEDLESGDFILDKIANHIILPIGDNPTLVVVSGAAELRSNQPFYKDVSDGDFLVIYPGAEKAIIYNSERDILVNVGPVVVDKDNSSQTVSPNTGS